MEIPRLSREKKKLETVTLLGIDCLNIERLILAAEICMKDFEFAEVKLLTSLPNPGNPHIVPIHPINSVEEYSRFALAELDAHVSTPHVLIIQHDGFILNPEAWSDDFLKYDYIGSPWFIDEWSLKFDFPKEAMGTLIVGNGGFCMRSKKLVSLCAELCSQGIIKKYHPEDTALCLWNRKLLEERGVQFAPVEVAKRFGFEDKTDESDKWDGQFGFHGLRWTDISKWSKAHPEYNIDNPFRSENKFNV